MNVRQAILAAMRREPDLLARLTESLKQRLDQKDESTMNTVVQAAEALEPIIAEAVERKPSRLGKLGLKSAHLLAGLAAEDGLSKSRIAEITRNATVGLVFVDVAGFTRFTAQRGDDAAIELLRRLHILTERVTKAGKGECVKHLGDGYFLAFPSASQAVRGAVSLRDAVVSERRSDGDFPVALRIAVHAGEPLEEQGDLLGHDVNLTARLLDHCEPDEIVVSEAAKEIAERRLRKITFRARREVKIRGLASKVVIFTVNPVRERHLAGRGSA